MYMREMGSVELLTHEGEMNASKRIEEGINEVQGAVAAYPEVLLIYLNNMIKWKTALFVWQI